MQRRRLDLAALLVLAGCATGQPHPPAGPSRPPAGPAPAAAPSTVPPQPVNPKAPKIGNPYQVFGIWYYPSDDRHYDARGVASWYGPGFHALNTANGETYDQQGISGAHKTLPLPSYVEVENLDNGRKLTVRLNDRGPFVEGRIIDLSRKAAQLLGVDRPGTAKVRVRRVFPDAATIASLEPPRGPVATAAPVQLAAGPPAAQAALPSPAAPTGIATPPAVRAVDLPAGGPAPAVGAPGATGAGGAFVQVAALSDPGRIAWLSGYLAGFGPVVTERTAAGLTRIRLGPYQSASEADATLARVRSAGYADARLVRPTPAP